MPQNLSAQIVCPSQRVWDFDEKRLHWASVVRAADTHARKQVTRQQKMEGSWGQRRYANIKTELIKVKMKDLWRIDEDDQKVSSNPFISLVK